MRSCLICDDDGDMREALAFTVSGRWPQARILLAKSFPEAWRLAAREPLYLCLADLAMPGATERDGIARLRAATPAPILVVTGSHDDALLLDLIGSGVAGFLPKLSTTEIIIAAIELVLAGGRYIPPRVAELALRYLPIDADPDLRLTPRQLDVLRLIAAGQSNRQIAEGLGIKLETVKSHVAQVIGAVGVANRTAAAMKARAGGLI